METKKKRFGKPFWTLVVAYLGNFIFFATLWLSTKYDQVLLDQFIYQLKSSTVGSNTTLVGSAVFQIGFWPILVTSFEVFLYKLFTGKLRRVGPKLFRSAERYAKVVAHKASKFIIRHLMPLACAALFLASTYFVAKLDFFNYVGNRAADSSFIEQHYVDPADVEITFPEEKRNLIYIFLESLEVTFAEPEAGGPIEENYMPELSQLAEENINFSHDDNLGGAYNYSGATWTAAAMVTQTCGVILQVPLTAPSFRGDNEYLPGVTSIGEILADAGYSNTILMGSHADFHDRGDYFQDHGDYDIYDTQRLKKQDRLDDDYFVWWGFEDYMLFDYAKEELTRLAAEDEPFNFTMITCDTHFPNGYPCKLCENRYGRQYPNVVRCSSIQVEEFISWIQQQPFYENTTIVLSGDHLTMDPDFMQTVDPDYQRTVYNCIINSPVEPIQEKNREFGTFDMMPTTLAALGVTIEGNRLGLGTNLFSDRKTLTEEFGHEEVDLEFQQNSEFYNQTFLGMD